MKSLVVPISLVFIIVLSLAQADDSDGHCVWYGECSTSTSKLNCLYNGTAKTLNDKDAVKILRNLCPDLVGNDPAPKLCCDGAQVRTMDKNFDIPRQLFARCPSCFRNFAQLWCQSTCSPVHSRFVKVTQTEGHSVAAIEYALTRRFGDGLFASCQNVQNPGSNQPALNIVCGTTKCTADKWLRYMGDKTQNPYVPFDIKISLYSENETIPLDITPQNATIIPCNDAPDNSSVKCSCQDCLQSCAAVLPYPASTEKQCYVGKIHCWTFLGALTFTSLTFAIVVIAILHYVITGSRLARLADQTDPPLPKATATVSEKNISLFERIGAWTESKLATGFNKWGRFCTRHPIVVLLFGLSVSILSSCGLYFMKVTTDPVELWSAPNSRARIEKDYFDEKFSPFYRTEQMIIIPKNESQFQSFDEFVSETFTYGAVFRKDFLHEVLDLQDTVANLVAHHDGKIVTLSDICFQPLAPDNRGCAIMSAVNYFQNNHSLIDYVHLDVTGYVTDANYLSHLRSCFDGPIQVADMTPGHLPCLAEFGGPIFPYVVLGGYDNENFTNATALVITFLVNNHRDHEKNRMAEAWENEFIAFLKNYTNENMTVIFSAERSVQDEINRQSYSDLATIVISYMVMFVYIAVALGQYKVYNNDLRYLLLQSKILLGLAGVVMVLLCVTSSVGLYAFCGVPATLIIVEVVPFLVLAVGVDNIFILVQAYQRDKTRHLESLEERIGRISGEVIPSMMLSSLAEVCCFFLGALSSMPAVRVFSMYAAVAIFFDFFLQTTSFLALFTLDIKREEAGRLEMCCCCVRVPTHRENKSEGFLYSLVRNFYTPFLLCKPVRFIVLILFIGGLSTSIAVINRIEIGLDQTLSMPDDSYVLRYFKALNEYLSVGPPVYFVVKGSYNYSDPLKQNMLCGSAGCYQDSLYGQIYSASQWKNRSYVAHPVSSWVDDYFDWLRPAGDSPCCRLYNQTGEFCPSTIVNSSCVPCQVTMREGRPSADDFQRYIGDFLKDNPNMKCSKGGHAAYGQAVHFDSNGAIDGSYYMTYHTILKTSADFVNALSNARKITENITAMINANSSSDVVVFPYSIFYVFYEQYLTVVHDGIIQLALSIGSIFIVSTLLLGLDPWSGAIMVITITMVLVDMLGLMYVWNIPFNAVSLVNLVMAVGISVEFCAHIVRAFAVSLEETRVERAKESLSTMGSSVLSGITLTKFGGIVVLAFSHSKIFQVFYFRMYLGIVIFGALHGLVFLPVLLCYVGPSVNKRLLLQRLSQDIAADGARFSSNSGLPASRSESFDSDPQVPMMSSSAPTNRYPSNT